MHRNHFCLIWKSNGISFNKLKEELNLNLKLVDFIKTNKHVKSFKKYE